MDALRSKAGSKTEVIEKYLAKKDIDFWNPKTDVTTRLMLRRNQYGGSELYHERINETVARLDKAPESTIGEEPSPEHLDKLRTNLLGVFSRTGQSTPHFHCFAFRNSSELSTVGHALPDEYRNVPLKDTPIKVYVCKLLPGDLKRSEPNADKHLNHVLSFTDAFLARFTSGKVEMAMVDKLIAQNETYGVLICPKIYQMFTGVKALKRVPDFSPPIGTKVWQYRSDVIVDNPSVLDKGNTYKVDSNAKTIEHTASTFGSCGSCGLPLFTVAVDGSIAVVGIHTASIHASNARDAPDPVRNLASMLPKNPVTVVPGNGSSPPS